MLRALPTLGCLAARGRELGEPRRQSTKKVCRSGPSGARPDYRADRRRVTANPTRLNPTRASIPGSETVDAASVNRTLME